MRLRDVKIKLEQLEAQKELLLGMREIEFQKTQPQSAGVKTDVVKTSTLRDKLFDYVVSIEDIDKELETINHEIKIHKECLHKHIMILDKYDDMHKKVIYLRELTNMTIRQIAKETYFSIGHVNRIIRDYKDETK